MKQIIKTIHAPAPIGPYNQAVAVTGKLLFTAGQIALDPTSGNIIGTSIEEQTKQVCENLSKILKAAGATNSDVVKTTVFLKNFNDFASMNKIYGEYFGSSAPARSTVEVSRLPKDVLIEVELVAEIP